MLKDVVLEYGAPIAVSLTLAVGGMTMTNSTDIAVLQSESDSMVSVQKDMIVEMKEMNRLIYRIDARTERVYEQR